MKGIARNDEPLAPFAYLLSPERLKHQHTRVTMQVIGMAVNRLPSSDVVRFVDVDRREHIKVSVHKTLLRLLTSCRSVKMLMICCCVNGAGGQNFTVMLNMLLYSQQLKC